MSAMFGVMNLVTIINIQRKILAKGERGSIQQNLETERFKLKLWMRKLKKNSTNKLQRFLTITHAL